MKIAVITNQPHYILGGVENYNWICFNDWIKKGHYITEFPTILIKNEPISNKKNPQVKIDYTLLGSRPYRVPWKGTYTKKNFKYIYDNFDLVIVSTIFVPKRWISNSKTILIQHMDKKWYQLRSYSWYWDLGLFMDSIFFGVSTIKNAFRYAKNSVFFSKETAFPNKFNQYYAPLTHKSKKQIQLIKKERVFFSWIGRLENMQKNVKAIIKIANNNLDVNIYGKGPAQKIVEKKLKNQNQYKGFVKQKNVDLVLQQSKALLVTSNFEGFSYVVIQALSNGVPAIVFNTYDACKFFEKIPGVFLVKKNDFQSVYEKMDFLRKMDENEYWQLSQKIIDFAKNNLDQNDFLNKWDFIIKDVYQKSLMNIKN